MAAEPLIMYGGAMNKGLFILIISIFIQPRLWAAAEQAAAESVAANEQLEINKNALLFGTDEQIRFKAASLMLDSGDPAARAVILQVLNKSENQQARLAVCQAIAESRGKRTIPNSEEFIGPLMAFLIEQRDPASVRLGTEALLIFRYEQIEQPLLSTIADKSLPLEARLNAVQALRLQPDIWAIVRLIELLDDSDQQVVSAAGEALKSLAIPVVGTDRNTRRQMIEEIQRIGKEEFLHYWRMRQEYERQIEQLKSERDSWRQKYLATLDNLYAKLGTDGAARIEFLAQYLVGARPEERLWAVSKVSLWLHGTEPKSNVRSELGPLLITLISDEDVQVRLNAARVLALMPELDSSQTLLAQLKVETDDEVRSELFAALGQACRYAFSPQSPAKPDGSIRKQTLDMAVEYLFSDTPAKAQRGAEVIRNLLEHDGLPEQEVSVYLEFLAGRYERNGVSNVLRGELLNSMAILCGQSAYSNQAAKRYRQYFVAALTEEDDLVREAAVNGLININKSEAYRRLRTDFVNDKSANIRKRLISLAEEIGTVEDLGWLSEKMGSNAAEAGAWKAMLRIFESGNSKLLSDWVEPLEMKKVAPVRMIAFLEIAERKAQADNNTALLSTVRYKLAGLLTQTQQRDKAKEYYGDLIKTDRNVGRRDQLRAELLELYLNDGQIKLASSLVANRLLEDDIDITCPIAQVLLGFVETSPRQAAALVEQLELINFDRAGLKPNWQQVLQALRQVQPVEPNQPPASEAV
jgi:HEAT repeat protein